MSRERLSQSSLLHLLPEHDQELMLTELAALAHGRTSARFVGRILDAGGLQRWLSWVVVPEDTLLYVVARDITSEREAALGLAEANAACASRSPNANASRPRCSRCSAWKRSAS